MSRHRARWTDRPPMRKLSDEDLRDLLTDNTPTSKGQNITLYAAKPTIKGNILPFSGMR